MRDLSFFGKRFRWPWCSMLAATLVVSLCFGTAEFFDLGAVPWFLHVAIWFIMFLGFLLAGF